MNEIEKFISRKEPDKSIFFSVWTRSVPKEGLIEYPKAIKTLGSSITSVALVDDILPEIMLGNNPNEQIELRKIYKETLPKMGFDKVHILSETGYQPSIPKLLSCSKNYTVKEFERILPKRKTFDGNDYLFSEIIEFTWHIEVLRFAIELLECTAIIAGMHTKFFYLVARKALPKLNLYFIGRNK